MNGTRGSINRFGVTPAGRRAGRGGGKRRFLGTGQGHGKRSTHDETQKRCALRRVGGMRTDTCCRFIYTIPMGGVSIEGDCVALARSVWGQRQIG